MWHREFNGLPGDEFLSQLDPLLSGIRERLYAETHTSDRPAGTIAPEWAQRLGIPGDAVVAVGAFDAHMGAIEMIKGDYEYETGLYYEEVEMVLIGNHAPFTWGKSLPEAIYNSAVLEECAKMTFLTLQIRFDALSEVFKQAHNGFSAGSFDGHGCHQGGK